MSTKTIIGFILVIAAICVFVFVIDPVYKSSTSIANEVSVLDTTLSNSRELQKRRDDLNSIYTNKFSPENITALEKFLPDSVDNVRLIIDVDKIISSIRAADPQKGITLGGVKMGTPTQNKQDVVLASGEAGYGSMTMTFTVNSTYPDFIQFIETLEQSLRAMDIVSISFDVGDKALTDYTVTVKTYWLKPTKFTYL